MDNSGANVTVVSPELISGITAKLSSGAAALSFDGLILDPVEVSGTAPLAAPFIIVEAICDGHVTSLGHEKFEGQNTVTVSILDTDAYTQTIWLDVNSGLPVHAELYSAGELTISCDFSDWHLA